MSQPLDQQRLRARERLLATLSHEIRTPLNGVLGMAGLLAGTRLDATQSAYLQTLRDCGEHLLALVNDVLDYAKLDGQQVGLEPVETDLEILLQSVCELLSPRAHAAGIEIAWAVREPAPRILADDGRLRQILFNLAGNAVKLTRRGGVMLQADTCGFGDAVTVRLTVSDTGPGIPQAQQSVIFEEFVQAEAGEAAGGAGLGLAIVKRLVEAFEGRLGVESTIGEGSRFWFEAEFPLAAPAAPDTRLSGVRVGVVSRSATIRSAACSQIAAAGGEAVVFSARNTRSDVDVVLVDPGPKAGLRPPLAGRSLVLLAPEERRRIDAARQAGFAGYLIKPLRRASVVERIAALIGPSRASAAPPRTVPDDERIVATPQIAARVLLAEDNPVNALLARTLLTQAGCSVDRAATGEEAITAALAAPYDLILMDVRMPGLSGMGAARRLREAGIRSPIVALTANTFEDDRRACLEAGMDDFLTKPLEPRALRDVLARWIDGRRSADTGGRSAVRSR